MRRAIGILFGFTACGVQGTDVGNAYRMEVAVSSDASAPETTLRSALALTGGSSAAAGSLTTAELNVIGLAVPPQSDCTAPLPSVQSWYRQRVTTDPLDFLSILSAGIDFGLSVELPQSIQTCQIRLVMGPATSGTHAGYSIWFEGQTAGGRSFLFRSSRPHLLVVSSATPFEVTESSRYFESVFHAGGFVARAGIEEGDGSPIVVEPDTYPLVFRAFLAKLRASVRGYR